MSNKTQTRWLNEYLDGEIGLADKAELERQMAANPELREEYTELRRIGLLMGSMPEITVHPYRFRQKLQSALEEQHSVYFTPQRAFAASMVFSLVIVCITFGLFFYQQAVSNGVGIPDLAPAAPLNVPAIAQDLTLDTRVDAEQFFNRLALECRVGLADPSLMSIMLNQTTVYEGATCIDSGGLQTTRFPAPLPLSVRIRILPYQVRDLAEIAKGVSGTSAVLEEQGVPHTVADVLQQYEPGQQLTLCLKFR